VPVRRRGSSLRQDDAAQGDDVDDRADDQSLRPAIRGPAAWISHPSSQPSAFATDMPDRSACS
jgi:hypothetical protein